MKFLVIGLGSIGMRHARNLVALGHEVLGCDIKGIPALDNLGIEMVGLDDVKEVDGCIIATPTVQHEADLHYALDRGWAHIFVEKPIADTVTAKLLNDLEYAKETHINVMVGNNLRFHPSVRLARRYIKGGSIGNPLWAHICVAQYNDKPDYLRDGVTLNWGAHEIDAALWLLGPATVAAASINKSDTIADICLTHYDSDMQHGCRSVVHLDYLTKSEMRDIVVVGDRGRIDASLFLRAVMLKQEERIHPADRQDGSSDDDYVNEMVAFVNTVQGNPWPGATAQNAVDTLKIIDKAREMGHEI